MTKINAIKLRFRYIIEEKEGDKDLQQFRYLYVDIAADFNCNYSINKSTEGLYVRS